MNYSLLGSSALASLIVFAGAANAQDSSDTPASVSAMDADDTTQQRRLGAVVVTANRREETIQDSSLIIQAVDGDELVRSGVTQAGDLSALVPGLEIGAAGSALQAYVRGVGNPGSTAVTNPAVPINVDGVYIARSQATAGNFFDLERVEVLKGPQGTLYGRNASGGAINLIPVRPNMSEVEGFLSAEIGNYDLRKVEGALNIPLSDTLAVRGSLQIVEREGYLSDGTDDDEHESLRLQALWQPSDVFSMALWGNYTHVGGRGGGYSYAGADDPWDSIYPGGNDILFAGAAARGLIAPQAAFPPGIEGPVAGPAPSPPFPEGSNMIFLVDPVEDTNYADMDFWNVHATLEWDLGFANLTIIPAYQDSELNYKIQPGLSFEVRGITENDAPEQSEASSLEVRLSNSEGRVNWVTGLYYFDESQVFYNLVENGLAQNFAVRGDFDTESLGVFADISLEVTDSFRLLGGLRYSDDTVEKSNFSRFAIAPALGPTLCFPGNAGDYNDVLACPVGMSGPAETVSFDDISWKAGFEYDLTPDNMLFATASTGYKAGGLSAAQGAPFDPETLTAFVLGSRNLFLDGDLQLNGELFWWLYDDHQEFLIATDSEGIVAQQIINAGEAYARGAAVDLVYAPTDTDRFKLAVEYNDAEYDEFIYQQSAQFTDPRTACAVSDTGVPADNPDFNILSIDCSGLQLSRAPEWSGTVAYTHDFNFSNGAELSATVDSKFASERWTAVAFLPGQRAPSYQLLNASLTYTSPQDTYSVTAYARNITEDEVQTNSNAHSVVSDLIGIAVGAPRTYGVRLDYRF